MASIKGWFLVAAGVAALSLPASDVRFCLNSIAQQSRARVQEYALHGTRYLAMAEIMLGRSQVSLGRTQEMVARWEGDRARISTECARVQAERIVVRVRERAAVCPRLKRVVAATHSEPVAENGTI
jgi:hypothetical protein